MTDTDLGFLENYRRVQSIFGTAKRPVVVRIPDPPPPQQKPARTKKVKEPKRPKIKPEPVCEDILKVMRVRGRDSNIVLDHSREVLRLVAEKRTWPFTSREIIENVSKIFGIKPEEIYRSSRLRKTIIAKHLVFWWIKKERFLSNGQIAKIFGHRDPSSIKHAVNQISNYIEVIEKDETKPLDTN